MLYVRGIFVGKTRDKYGYDLDLELNHERQVVADQYEFERKKRECLEAAVAARPDLMIAGVSQLIETGAEDAQGFNWDLPDPEGLLSKMLATKFIERHGADAVPCETLDETKKLEHFGRLGVVVGARGHRRMLQARLGDPKKIEESMAEATTRLYHWSELSIDERRNLLEAVELASVAFPALKSVGLPTLSVVDVVDFAREGLLGLGGERVRLAHKILVDFRRTLEILVHECAHHETKASDGEKAHVARIEDAWSAIVAHLRAGAASNKLRK